MCRADGLEADLIKWWIILLALGGLSLFWMITKPAQLDADVLAGLTGDSEQGELVFHAAGCASCHAAPDAKGADKLRLAGGRKFPSDFGTFIAPNISPDPTHGIGAWSDLELVTAITKGVSPEGKHYFPAFPYGAYDKAEKGDIVSLIAYLRTLPADATPSQPHDVGFPFNIRRLQGGWKFLFQKDGWVMENADTPQLERGRYLVESLSHCAECHTPRNRLGGLNTKAWLTGAPIPGKTRGRSPGITPSDLEWSEDEIVEYLTSGFTPDFDSAGGHMVDVIENMEKLPLEDRQAIAAYLKALP